MRRYLYIALSLLLAGCTSSFEPTSTPLVGVVPQQLTVAFEQPLSRSVVQGERFIYWCEGDEISFFAATSDNLQYRLHSVEAESAKFIRVGDSAPLGESLSRNYGVYPYSEATAVTADGNIRVDLPALQNYAKDSFGDDSATMVAVSNDANATLRFQSIVGFLKLQLYGENIRVKRIEFGGNRGEKVAGTVLVSVAEGSVATVAMDGSASDVVTLDCGEGVLLSSDSAKPTAFWLTLPPQLFAEGFVITIYDDKGTPYVKSTSKPYAIDRNMIQPMKAVDVVVRPEDIYLVNNADNGDFTGVVKSCIFKGVHYEMFIETDKGYELMIQDYNAFEGGYVHQAVRHPRYAEGTHSQHLCGRDDFAYNGQVPRHRV